MRTNDIVRIQKEMTQKKKDQFLWLTIEWGAAAGGGFAALQKVNGERHASGLEEMPKRKSRKVRDERNGIQFIC